MALGPRRHVPRPPRHPCPPAPVRAGLTWAARHAADRAASREFRVGGRPMAQQPLRESLGAPSAGGKEREAGSRSRRSLSSGRQRPASATWSSTAPPCPCHLEKPRLRGRARAGSPEPQSPYFLPASRPLGCPSPLPARDHHPVPAHLTRPQFRAFGTVSHLQQENPHRDLTPPGLTSGGPRVCTLDPAPPRSLASNPLPSSKPRPDPTGLPPPGPPPHSASPAPSYFAPPPPSTLRPVTPADHPAEFKFLAALPPSPASLSPGLPKPVAALGSHGLEHTALLSRLSAFCSLCSIMQDRLRDAELREGQASVTQPGAQVQPRLLVDTQRKGVLVSLMRRMGPENAALTWQRQTLKSIRTVYSEAIRSHALPGCHLACPSAPPRAGHLGLD